MEARIAQALEKGGVIDITTTGSRSGEPRRIEIVLHNIDGLRQSPRARGLDGEPREQYGDIEVPKAAYTNPAARSFVQNTLGGGRFTDVTLELTAHQLQIKELGWTFSR